MFQQASPKARERDKPIDEDKEFEMSSSLERALIISCYYSILIKKSLPLRIIL